MFIWVNFQFCIHYIQLPFGKKWLTKFPRGGECPSPQMKPWVFHTHQASGFDFLHFGKGTLLQVNSFLHFAIQILTRLYMAGLLIMFACARHSLCKTLSSSS